MKKILLVLLTLSSLAFGASNTVIDNSVEKNNNAQNKTICIDRKALDVQRSGCCSWHGGVAGCSSSGRIVCSDGTLSPSCTCNSNINPLG